MEATNFENESTLLVERIFTIVKPQYIKGFIYSFFIDEYKSFGRKIKPIIHDSMMPFGRRSDLYNIETEEITLLQEEIDSINDTLFKKKLEYNYSVLFQRLDAFHRCFKESVDSDSLIRLYKTILEFLDIPEGAYGFSNFNSINGLTINSFKNDTTIKLSQFREAVKEKIDFLEKNSIEDYPRTIFTDKKYYDKFKEYQSRYIENPYNDYSFLFTNMKIKEMTKTSFKKACEWLSNQGYIDNNTYNYFLEKGSFNTKADSKLRKERFDTIFYEK